MVTVQKSWSSGFVRVRGICTLHTYSCDAVGSETQDLVNYKMYWMFVTFCTWIMFMHFRMKLMYHMRQVLIKLKFFIWTPKYHILLFFLLNARTIAFKNSSDVKRSRSALVSSSLILWSRSLFHFLTKCLDTPIACNKYTYD